MDTFFTILWQIVTMFVLAGIGFLMFRSGKITSEGSKSLGNILICLSLPCVIINSFLVENTPERVTGFLLSALMAAVILGISILVSRLVLGRHAIDNFAGAFSNPGFFGVPLIVSALSSGDVFYIASFIAFLNLLQWTYGVSLLESSDESGMIPSGHRKAGLKPAALLLRIVKAPSMIAIFIGCFFFLTGIPMPEVPAKCISAIAGLNTPLAMFSIGIYMAQTDVKKMFTKHRLYLVSLVRLVIVPVVAVGLLWLLPASMGQMKLAILIAAACPVGNNIAVYAQLHNRDYTYAVETVVISTLLSAVTLPVLMSFAVRLFGV